MQKEPITVKRILFYPYGVLKRIVFALALIFVVTVGAIPIIIAGNSDLLEAGCDWFVEPLAEWARIEGF